jgi:signal transduction histidine kinase
MVCLLYGERDLDLAVDDTGGALGDRLDDGGFGLIGMRERVNLYGGTLEAGPHPGGGFSVRARLPFREGQPA